MGKIKFDWDRRTAPIDIGEEIKRKYHYWDKTILPANAEEAIERLGETHPDLILSCSWLRMRFRFSHQELYELLNKGGYV